MSRRPRRRKSSRIHPLIWLGLLLLAAMGVKGWKDLEFIYSPVPQGQGQEQGQRPPRRTEKVTKVFEVMPDARLVEDTANDGDSFKISYRGQTHVFRLYFADCPEKRRDGFNGDRLREQGDYFGGLGEARTVALGQQAHAFAHQWLTQRPFTVYTKWQPVFNSGRHYAFIVFPDGDDLSAKLVREGLARIHTTGAVLPDGRSAAKYQGELRLLEQDARAARRGGWAR